MLKQRDFVTLHVPLVPSDAPPDRRASGSALMKPGAVLLNFARDGVVDDDAVLDGAAPRAGSSYYVCDFPERRRCTASRG